jgi:photosystem II stability/assembly factor-like uncharacterized protein
MRIRNFLVLFMVLGGGLLDGCTQEAQRTQTPTNWEHVVASPLNHTIFGAAFPSAEEGWAVGERGAILHYHADKWESVNPSPTDRHLFSVAFPTPREGWAVGAWGTFLRYDGAVWKTVDTPPGLETVNLERVVFLSPENGWAVGDSAGIARYDGKTWSKVEAPVMRLLQERQGKVDTEQYGLVAEAIGEAGFEEEAGYFHDIAFLAPHNGWIVGNLGQILHYNGEKWQEVESPTRRHLYSLACLPSGNAWAVGQEGTILQYSGRQEKWMVWPSSPTHRHLLSLVALSDQEAYAVGQGGIILRYDGTEWREYEGPHVKRMVNFYFVTFQGSSDQLWTFSTTRAMFYRNLNNHSPRAKESS